MINNNRKKEDLVMEKGRPNGFKFEDYNANGKKNNRKLNKPNSFKSKIYHLLKNIEEENVMLGKTANIMFLMAHAEAHKDFLLNRMEEEPNYYRTYNNIEKCKARCVVELFDKNIIDNLNIKLNKNNKKDKKLWKILIELKYQELTITNTVSYDKVRDFIPQDLLLEETDELKDCAMLGDNELNRQQWFEFSLRDCLNSIDEHTMELIKIKTDLKNS